MELFIQMFAQAACFCYFHAISSIFVKISFMRPARYCILFIALSILTLSCKRDEDTAGDDNTSVDAGPITPSTNVTGYSMLEKLPAIWNGPVISSTPLGSYPEWIMDMRPVSAAQVSGKSELDKQNDILLGFFIVKHGNAYKMALRNGGGFAGNKRIAYAVIDSVMETPSESFYRFSDFRAGKNRVYTEVIFKADSLIMKVYTNKYNTLSSPQMHMVWRARSMDSSSAQPAIAQFGFPKKELVKDFSTTFDTKPEAIYYDLSTDPYNESMQPHLGRTDVSVSISSSLPAVDPNKKVFLLVTTQPLFSGLTFNPAQMKFRSRYVFIPSTDQAFTFNYMHPGPYYLYAFYDNNGDGTFSSGDYMSSDLSNTFTLGPQGVSSVSASIDMIIP
jgi:hypothetical protein